MNRLKRMNQRMEAWEQRHPGLASGIMGAVLGLTYGILQYAFSGESVQASAFLGISVGTFAALFRWIVIWPMIQRRRQNPPGRQRRAWEIAIAAGVFSMLTTWNLVLFIVGFDASFAMVIAPGLLVGIVVALLVYRWRAHS